MNTPTSLVLALVVLASCTKSAQLPFSAWLPAAMAAPTPVSSLVHSSTLVTAGVYLIIRFCPLLLFSKLQVWLLWVGMMTIILAGLAAITENDIKKIVALSTLRQLGVIMVSLGAGYFNAAFFHLLAHAFFKALLFVTVGRLIHIAVEFQDLRKARLSFQSSTLRLSVNLGATFRLCGIPFTSGFFSKDLCIELFFQGSANTWLTTVFIVATAFTVAYRARFLYNLTLGYSRLRPWSNMADSDSFITLSIGAMYPVAIIRGAFLSWGLFSAPAMPILRLSIKNLVLCVVFLRAVISRVLLFKKKTNIRSVSCFIFRIWGIPFISRRFLSKRLLLEAWSQRKFLDLA